MTSPFILASATAELARSQVPRVSRAVPLLGVCHSGIKLVRVTEAKINPVQLV